MPIIIAMFFTVVPLMILGGIAIGSFAVSVATRFLQWIEERK